MSSVLKALQRLEKQRSLEKISARPDFNTVDASSVIRRKARQSHYSERRRLLGIIALVIGLGVLAVMAYNTFWKAHPKAEAELAVKTASATNAPADTPLAKTSTPVARPGEAATPTPAPVPKSNPPTPPKVIARHTPSSEFKPPARPPRKAATNPKTRPTPPPTQARSRKRPARPSIRKKPKKPMAVKPAQSNAPLPGTRKPAVKPQAATGGKTKTVEKAAQSTLPEAPKELGLKLQAITWLNDPRKRFTVINENIVRLGERVDGYRLTKIQEDQITIEKDGQKWLLKFTRMDFPSSGQ